MAALRPVTWILAFGLALLVMIVAGLTAFAIHVDEQAIVHSTEQRTASMARLILAHSESALEDANKLIVAVEPDIADWDFEDTAKGQALFDRMRDLMLGSPQISSAWVVDGKGLSRLDTWTFPSRPLEGSARPYFKAHQDGAPDPLLRGDQRPGAITGQERFTFSRAIRDPDGSLRAIVVVGVYQKSFENLYAEAATWKGARAGLYIEGVPFEQSVLARLRTVERASPEFVTELSKLRKQGPSGTGMVAERGTDRLVSWQSSSKYPGLYATASQPLDAALADWRARSIFLASASVLGVLCLVAIAYFASGMSRERNRRVAYEILGEEVNHRVKNSLQMVGSLLTLKASSAKSLAAKSELVDGAKQLSTIASLYEHMQISKQGREVDVMALLRSICEKLSDMSTVELSCHSAGSLTVDSLPAINVAVLANELITNAVKHAASSVEVGAKWTELEFELRVSDDGEGFPPGFNLATSTRFGLVTAQRLIRVMGGQMHCTNGEDGGAVVKVTLPPSALTGGL